MRQFDYVKSQDPELWKATQVRRLSNNWKQKSLCKSGRNKMEAVRVRSIRTTLGAGPAWAGRGKSPGLAGSAHPPLRCPLLAVVRSAVVQVCDGRVTSCVRCVCVDNDHWYVRASAGAQQGYCECFRFICCFIWGYCDSLRRLWHFCVQNVCLLFKCS